MAGTAYLAIVIPRTLQPCAVSGHLGRSGHTTGTSVGGSYVAVWARAMPAAAVMASASIMCRAGPQSSSRVPGVGPRPRPAIPPRFTPFSAHSAGLGAHQAAAMHRNPHTPGLRNTGRDLELGSLEQTRLAAARDPGETAPLLAPERDPKPSPAESAAEHQETVDWLATGLCFIFPAIGGLLFGYDIGATSGVLVSLTSEQLSGTDWYQLSAFQSGTVVSGSLLGALGGALIALAAGNSLGRRTELLAASCLYGAAAAGMGAVSSLNSLLAARFLYGVGMGLAMHAAPAYIAETAPPSARGLLISLKEAVIVGGILLGYASSYWFIDDVGGWRNMYGLAAPLALLLGVGMLTLPESPRWLLLSGAGRDEALTALIKAEGKRAANRALAEAEIDAMAASVAEAQQHHKEWEQRSTSKGAAGAGAISSGSGNGVAAEASSSGAGGGAFGALGELFGEQRYFRPLLVGMSLMLFQQITGQPSVLYYAASIFEAAGFSSGQEAAGVSVLLGSFKLAMTFLAVVTVDKWGRRPLLLAGVSGMVVALVGLSIAQGSLPEPEAAAAAVAAGAAPAVTSTTAAWTSAAALLLYVGSYQMSFGPISWLLVGELFPLSVRSSAIALATLVNFGSNFGVSLLLPSLEEGLGMQATYAMFAVIGAGAVAYIYKNVPETKGRTLEEIEELWRKDEKEASS